MYHVCPSTRHILIYYLPTYMVHIAQVRYYGAGPDLNKGLYECRIVSCNHTRWKSDSCTLNYIKVRLPNKIQWNKMMTLWVKDFEPPVKPKMVQQYIDGLSSVWKQCGRIKIHKWKNDLIINDVEISGVETCRSSVCKFYFGFVNLSFI